MIKDHAFSMCDKMFTIKSGFCDKIDDMIQVLIGQRKTMRSNTPQLAPKEAAIKALLKKSFQPPQKGMAREHCSTGHKLEKPNLKSWLEASNDRYFPVEKLDVTSAYTAGLAAKKGDTRSKR